MSKFSDQITITTGEEMYAAGRRAAPKILLFGPSGSGKTSLLASVDPDCTGLALFVALEPQGVEVAIGVNPKLHIYDVHTAAKDRNLTRYQLLRELGGWMMKENFPYRVVCIDGLTELSRAILDDFHTKTAKGEVTDTDWMGYTGAMQRYLTFVRDVQGVTVVMSCLTETQFDADHVYRLIPAIEGKKLPPTVPAYCNAVGYTFRQETEQGESEYLTMFSGPERYTTKPMCGLARTEPSNLRRMLARIYAALPGDSESHAPWDLREGDADEIEPTLPPTHESAEVGDRIRKLKTAEALAKAEKKTARAEGKNPGGVQI